MYGVPTDLPLHVFIGHELNQIALGRFQVQFHFSRAGSICVEGKWELRAPSGELMDAEQEHASRPSTCVHRILDLPVVAFEIDAPRSFTLIFAPAWRLQIFDEPEGRYEQFSVHVEGEGSFFV